MGQKSNIPLQKPKSDNHNSNQKQEANPITKSGSSKILKLQNQLSKEPLSLEESIAPKKGRISSSSNNTLTNFPSNNFMPTKKLDFGNGGEFKISLQPVLYDIETNNKEVIEKKGSNKQVSNKPFRQSVQFEKVVRDINQFQFIKVIGKGTFGKVILAKNKDDNELYALKCVKKDYIIKTKNLENIKNEKAILEKLDNPFIIKLHFTFQNNEKIFFAFSYCNGGELFFHLSKNRRFKEDYVKIYAAEIYIALKYLHEKNIIYRDLKPENIILDKNGHIKLIDFGLAKSNISANNLTSSICGTKEYIPPEVISGAKYSYNFDWWGFGVILYELMYGYPPFVDQTKSVLFKKIKESEPNYDAVKISNEAKDLIQNLLQKDLHKRLKPDKIPYHEWFSGLNFDEVRDLKVKAPFIPKIKNEDDLSNIDPVFLNENIYSPVQKREVDFDKNSFIDF